MAKRKVKEDIKKPDAVMRFFGVAIDWVRGNIKICIIGLVIILILCSTVFAYMAYAKRQNDKIQYALSQGMQAFAEFSASGSIEKLNAAEAIFTDVIKQKGRESSLMAKLYLGNIMYIKGQSQEARDIYREVAGAAGNSLFKTLAEKGMEQIDKK